MRIDAPFAVKIRGWGVFFLSEINCVHADFVV